ncbi:hypothetical protein Bbelb_198020 [Branchiostoma belcheri]|nr:hypothetical protein Bbelb_198020 [Branchiostoma belcheri]
MAETALKSRRLPGTASSAVKTEGTDSVAVKLVLDGEIADDVVLRGSWDDWSRDWDLKRNKKKLENSVCLDLPCGYYQYKYRGGRRWFCDKSKPMVPNAFGTLNNYMEVKKVPETSSAIVQGLRSKTTHINVKIQKNVDLEVLRSKSEATQDETPVIDTDKKSRDTDVTESLTQADEFKMVIGKDGNLEGRLMTKSITEDKIQMEAIVSGTEFFQANPALPTLVLPTVERKPYDKDDLGTTTKDEAKNASQDMEKTSEAEPTTEETDITEEADIRPGPDLVANIEEKVSAQMTTTKKTAERPVPDLVKNTDEDRVPSETATSNTDESDSWGVIDVSEENTEPTKTIGDIVETFDDNVQSERAEPGEAVLETFTDIGDREEGEVVSVTSSDLVPTEGNEEPAKTIGGKDIVQPFDDNAPSERAESGEAVQGASTDIGDREEDEVVSVTSSDLVPTEGNEGPAKTIGGKDIVQPFDDNAPSERAELGEAVQEASTDIDDREEGEVVLVTSSDLVPTEGNEETAKEIGDIVQPLEDNTPSEKAVQETFTDIGEGEEEVVLITSSDDPTDEGTDSDEECYELVLKMMGIAEGIQDLIQEVPGVQAPILHTTDQTEDVSTRETPIPYKTTEKVPCTTEKAQAQDEPSSQVTPDTIQGSKEALAMATSIKVEISEKDFPESIATTSVEIDSAEAKVVVKGSWDGWSEAYMLDRSADGVYSVTLMLPAGLHEYKFRLGNKWFHNDTKPVVPNVFGTLNNYLEVRKLPDDGITNQDQGTNKVAHTSVKIQKEIDLETIEVAQNSKPKRQDDKDQESEDDGDLNTTTDVEPGGQKYEDMKSLEDNSFTDEVSLAMHDGQKPIPNTDEQPEQKAFPETTESGNITEEPVSDKVIEEPENDSESNCWSVVSENDITPADDMATKGNVDIVETVKSTTITGISVSDNTAEAETPPADDMATKGNAEKTVKNTAITEISAPDDNTAAAETAQPAEATVLEKTEDEIFSETLASGETFPGDNQMPKDTTVTKTTTSDDPPEKNLSEFAEKPVDGTETEPARSTDAAMLECIDVKLVWKGATSGDVVLQGSWDGWRRAYKLNKSDQGEYSMSLKLPFGQHEYKFRVGKSWIEDETKPTVPNVFGTQNNILKVPDVPETDNKTEETKPTDETILKQTSYAEESETTYTVRPQTEDTTEDKPTTEALLEEQNMNDSFSTEAQTSDETTGGVNSVNAIKGEETASTGKETKEQVHDTGLGVLETLADKLSTEICQSVEGVMKTIQEVNEKAEDRVDSSSPSEDSKTAEEVVLDTSKKTEVTTETTTEGDTAKKTATDIVGVVKRNQQAEKMVEETSADFAEDTSTDDAIDTLSSEEILKNNLQDISERSEDSLYTLNQPEEPTGTVAMEAEASEEVLPDKNPEGIPTNAAPSDEIDVGADLYEEEKPEEKTSTETTADEISTNTLNKTQDVPNTDLPAPNETVQITDKLQTTEDTDATEASPAEKTPNSSSDDKGTTVEPLGEMIENITPDDFPYNAEQPTESKETGTDEKLDTESRSPLPEIREEESEDEADIGKSSGQRRVKITFHDCSDIKLLWQGEAGGDVFLQGSWDGWTQSHKLKKGDYSVTLKLPVGLHEYKFRIGNSWFHDKAKTSVLNCWNTPNNVINVA